MHQSGTFRSQHRRGSQAGAELEDPAPMLNCFVAITLVAGITDQAAGRGTSYLRRDSAFLLIGISPPRGAVNEGARAAVTTTKGVFYVRETPREILDAPCYSAPKTD